jgi:hypothetical protein
MSRRKSHIRVVIKKKLSKGKEEFTPGSQV